MYAASTVVPVRDASTLSAAQVFGALWAFLPELRENEDRQKFENVSLILSFHLYHFPFYGTVL
jgi:hypothetical protein